MWHSCQETYSIKGKEKHKGKTISGLKLHSCLKKANKQTHHALFKPLPNVIKIQSKKKAK